MGPARTPPAPRSLGKGPAGDIGNSADYSAPSATCSPPWSAWRFRGGTPQPDRSDQRGRFGGKNDDANGRALAGFERAELRERKPKADDSSQSPRSGRWFQNAGEHYTPATKLFWLGLRANQRNTATAAVPAIGPGFLPAASWIHWPAWFHAPPGSAFPGKSSPRLHVAVHSQSPDTHQQGVRVGYCWTISSGVAPPRNALQMVSKLMRVPRTRNTPSRPISSGIGSVVSASAIIPSVPRLKVRRCPPPRHRSGGVLAGARR